LSAQPEKLDPRVPFGWAVRDARLPANRKAVLWGLRERANERLIAYPGTALLALDAGVGRSTIFEALDELEEIGWLCRHPTGRATRYELLIPGVISPAAGLQMSITRPGDVQLADVSSPAPGHEVENQEEREEGGEVAVTGRERFIRDRSRIVVAGSVTQSLREATG
jgi:helix-turn-helix protein